MNYRIILSPGARADIRAAARWYEREDMNLVVRFLAEIRMTLRRVAQNPKAFPIRQYVVQRALTRKFPYAIYLTLYADAVFVRAVSHQRRADTVWLNRSNGRV